MSELYEPEDPDEDFFYPIETDRFREERWVCRKCGWDFTAICYGDMDDWWHYDACVKLEGHKNMCKILVD